MGKTSTPSSILGRLGWLLAIWTTSVAVLGVVALIFRGLMSLAGMAP